MRKSVLFLIGIIFIVSVVVVTFFGMKVTVDQFKVYINKVEITTYDRIIRDRKYKTVELDETEGYTSLFIEYNLGPDNATELDGIVFTISGNTYIDENGEEQISAEISPTGELVFYRAARVTVTIRTTDGSEISDSVLVSCV